MNLKRLVILFSFLLVLAPASVAYSALLAEKEPQSGSHCMQADQQHEQQDKSCCDDAQCGPLCTMMHCSQFSKLSALHETLTALLQAELSNFSPPDLHNEPGGGWLGSLLRPPIHTI
jgi:hypothetical protein